MDVRCVARRYWVTEILPHCSAWRLLPYKDSKKFGARANSASINWVTTEIVAWKAAEVSPEPVG
jgi:hypothetical protein